MIICLYSKIFKLFFKSDAQFLIFCQMYRSKNIFIFSFHYQYFYSNFFLSLSLSLFVIDKKKGSELSCDKHCSGLKCKILEDKRWLNCSCKTGSQFKFSENGRECVDTNECIEQPSLCSQQCINLLGSHKYKCRCTNGYEYNSLSKGCKVKGEKSAKTISCFSSLSL